MGSPNSIDVKVGMAEAMGIGSASSIRPEGLCRIPFPDLRTDPAVVPRWPSRRHASSPVRYRVRARRLTPEQESAIRTLSGSKSLRSLAADFDVSHETIRAVLRQARVRADRVPPYLVDRMLRADCCRADRVDRLSLLQDQGNREDREGMVDPDTTQM